MQKQKAGRISIKKTYTPNQVRAIQKATEQYLKEETSIVKGVKEYTKKASKQAGKELSYVQASDIFKVRYNYTWIYEYMTPSEFWNFVKVAKEENWNKQTFINELSDYITNIPDEDLKNRLALIYDYVMME